MAFVFRSQQNATQPRPNASVGPGSYNFEVQCDNRIPKAYVPFGSMQPKCKSLAMGASQVGPGSYNLDFQHSGQKIIVSSETEDIKILQISRPTPVFKSGVARFAEHKEETVTPGPGDYNLKAGTFVPRPKMLSTNAVKPKILEHLININQYQYFPSIPSDVHAYGYSGNQENKLELNQPPIEYFKGEKNDFVGPGQYNPNVSVVKARGLSWSQPKAKRQEEQKPSNIGPGSYDPSSVSPLYNYKPTAGFASKTLRTMDQRKGAIQNIAKGKEALASQVNGDQLLNPGESRMLSQKAPPSTNIDSDEDSYEYIEETTPGPGSYLDISHQPKLKAGKTASSFGGSNRFEHKDYASTKFGQPNLPGPGSYNIEVKQLKKPRRKQKRPAKETPRCPSLVNKIQAQLPGPGAYEPRNTMEDKLIYKIQRGYRGQFGSTEARSKEEEEEDELPGPGSYNPQLLPDEKEIGVSAFKSKLPRKAFDCKVGPAVGAYNLTQNDIANRVIKEQQQDPDLVIKKPGFGVGENRFKEPEPRLDDYDDEDIIKEIQEKHRQEKNLRMLKNSAAFKSEEPRLKAPKSIAPGPGTYYDGEEDYWNKRTYNILFADI